MSGLRLNRGGALLIPMPGRQRKWNCGPQLKPLKAHLLAADNGNSTPPPNALDIGTPWSMIRKSGNRFSDKIMLKQRDEIVTRFRGNASRSGNADVAELVDARDLKSLDGNVMWVRVPPPAPHLQRLGACESAHPTLRYRFNLLAFDFFYFLAFAFLALAFFVVLAFAFTGFLALAFFGD